MTTRRSLTPPRLARTLAPLMIVVLLAGCDTSRQASLSAWQDQAQSWVINHGNGDMNSLRDLQVAPGRSGLRVFNADLPEESKDFAGVLVGPQPAAGAVWYVYVLGEVDKQQVIGSRLAAVSGDGVLFNWRMGEDDKAATAVYRQYREKAFALHDGQGPTTMPASSRTINFPNADDQFEMTASGDVITVRETGSGARWTLNAASATGGESKAGKH